MATFDIGKGKDDIQEGVLLPEDWYVMELTQEPTKDKNNAWKEAGERLSFNDVIAINAKAGENIILRMKVESETPEFNGRGFTKWLSLPNSADENLYMNDGQPKADWKASVIHKWVAAFGGVSEGTEISFSQGQKALVYVTQEQDNRDGMDGVIVNSISMNIHPRALGGGGGSSPLETDPLNAPPTLGGANNVPF